MCHGEWLLLAFNFHEWEINSVSICEITPNMWHIVSVRAKLVIVVTHYPISVVIWSRLLSCICKLSIVWIPWERCRLHLLPPWLKIGLCVWSILLLHQWTCRRIILLVRRCKTGIGMPVSIVTLSCVDRPVSRLRVHAMLVALMMTRSKVGVILSVGGHVTSVIWRTGWRIFRLSIVMIVLWNRRLTV